MQLKTIKDSQSLVSICIPTYNGEKYLQQALDSVKAQTYKNIEVIISDDKSVDRTLEICEQFKSEVDFPVFIHHHIPQGIGQNWDNCVVNSKGDYIKFLFQDDVLEQDCISKQLLNIQDYNLEIVVCQRKIIDYEGELLVSDWLNRFGDLQAGINLNIGNFYTFSKKDLYRLGSKNPLQYNFIGEPITALFSRELYYYSNGFGSPLKQFLDLEFWLKILKKYPIGISSEKLVKFRFHSGQTSAINIKKNIDEVDYIENLICRNFFFNLYVYPFLIILL